MDTKKLRQKLLDLAIRGKLVPQDPNDEPASELLARIREEKLDMVERGELKPKDVKNDTVIYFGSDGLPYEKRADGRGEAKCIEEEIPFVLPEGWSWARLQSLSRVVTDGDHQAPPQIANGVPFLVISNIANGVICFDNTRFVPRTYFEKIKPQRIPQRGDLLLSVTGSYGIPAVVNTDRDFCFQRHIALIKPFLSASFLSRVVSSSYCSKWFDKKATGTAQKTVALSILRSTLIPVPPLAEQVRIVGALGKYLALVDGIERDRAELDSLFVQLKSKVLDLAVRGELTERDPEDEPASELLARIREEKLAMVGRGELKPKDVEGDTVIFTGSDGLRYEKPAGEKGETKCIEGEIPFEIPKGWGWCRLLTPVALDPKNDTDDKTPVSFLPMAAIEEGFRNQYHPEVRPWKEVKKGFTQFADGDVVFAKISPCFENGKYFIASGLENGVGAGTTELYVLRSPSKGLYRKYLFYFLASNYFMGDAKKTFMGSVGQQRIKKDYLERMLLPVPPLTEQRRIVETIEAAFNLTNL